MARVRRSRLLRVHLNSHGLSHLRFQESFNLGRDRSEDWLKGLSLAQKTRRHIRTLTHTTFQCAMRWELSDKNPIKWVRVRVEPSAFARRGY